MLIAIFVLLGLLLRQTPAEAARSHTTTQTNPAPPGDFDMGSTQNIVFRVANANTGGNTGERIYQMRFRLNSGSTFTAATAAPAGWTRTAYSTTSVTFRATSWANAIVLGGTCDFTLTILMRTTTQDATTEHLRDSLASYTTTTTGPPFTRAGTNTVSAPGSWQLRSLSITSFQITDCAGTLLSSVAAGGAFCLVMAVKNVSSTTQTTIVSVTNPPTATKTGTVTNTLVSTTYSPNPLSLATGASGTATFRYSTNAADSGTIFFTASARNNNGAGSATSRSATSTTLSVSRFIASISVNPTCQYRNYTVTVTMTLTNGFPNPVLNVTPTLTPSVGAPITLVSGPTPAAPNGPVPAGGGTFVFSWIYQVNAAAVIGATFTFSGSATGTQTPPGTPLSTTNSTSGAIRVGGFNVSVDPASTYAGSTNEELTWTVENLGCADVNQVAVTVLPAGWTLSGDSYSVVNNTAGSLVETWTVGGTAFTAPNATDRMPYGETGDFLLGFSGTPAATGTGTFTVRVTDSAGQFRDVDTPVTVNAFDNSSPGQGNYTGTGVWREEVH